MPLVFAWIGLISGWLAGYVVNYICDVMPMTRRLSPILCLNCGQTVSVVDYTLLKRCKNCHRPLNRRNWIIQVVFGLIGIGLWLHPPGGLGYWLGLALLIYLGSILIMDLEYRVVLNQMAVVGFVISMGIGIILHGFLKTIIGGIAGFGIMLAIYYLGAFYARWMARRRGETFDDEAMGYGDVNLSGIIGLLLGWPGIVLGLVLAILLGGLVSLIILIILVLTHRYKTFASIPYAPFLVIGTVLLLFILK